MNVTDHLQRTLAFAALVTLAACQPEEGGVGAATAMLPTDIDLGHGYVKRDGAIHFIGGGITGKGANATRIDTPSPQLLRKVKASKFGPFETCEGLDVANFEALSEEYTRDKERVYHKVGSPGEFIVIVLPEADPASFEVLAFNVAKDKNHFWYYHTIVAGVDPATVQVIKDGPVFKDLDSVHYQLEPIVGADPSSFKHLGAVYYADRSRVYWGPDPIPDADPASFKVLGDSFVATDKFSAYRSGKPLPVFDVATLELILHDPAGYQILSDKNGIHLNTMTFPRSKPGKVKVIDQATLQSGDLMFLVDTVWVVPVTVFKDQGRLMAETLGYDHKTREALGMIRAEVTEQGLREVQTIPLSGRSGAPSIPDFQIKAFKSPHLLQRMIEAGKRIK